VQKAEDEIRDADRLANKGMKGAKVSTFRILPYTKLTSYFRQSRMVNALSVEGNLTKRCEICARVAVFGERDKKPRYIDRVRESCWTVLEDSKGYVLYRCCR
jgi:hypothetical protein